MLTHISVRGAREHNLKAVNVDIPRESLTVITGLSGSGKSSLAFDTIYAEGQRRYVESLSPYARQFLGLMERQETAMGVDERLADGSELADAPPPEPTGIERRAGWGDRRQTSEDQ